MGASGMATLLQATLSDLPEQEIRTVNHRGYYGTPGLSWKVQFENYEQKSLLVSTEPEEEESAVKNSSPTHSTNGVAPEFRTLAQLLMIQTGCPLKVIQPGAYLEGDLRLNNSDKRSVLRNYSHDSTTILNRPCCIQECAETRNRKGCLELHRDIGPPSP
ncbi:MAG: hypothetical protein R3C11_19095 [Planctomycetaceae bacterium]